MSAVAVANPPSRPSWFFALDKANSLDMKEWRLNQTQEMDNGDPLIQYFAEPGDEGYLILGQVDEATGVVHSADVVYTDNRHVDQQPQGSWGPEVIELFKRVRSFVSQSTEADDSIALPAIITK